MLKTKYGNAQLTENGHYRITSRKEGNHNKFLHRLIWEKNYGEIPKGMHIHHIDGNPQNNCILNLQLMTKGEHHTLHNQGKVFSPETRKKMSESASKNRNKTGILHVSIQKNKKCKQGFFYRYMYHEGKKRKYLNSTDLGKLKKKVLAKGMDWIELEQMEE